jgi:hypothetical protein
MPFGVSSQRIQSREDGSAVTHVDEKTVARRRYVDTTIAAAVPGAPYSCPNPTRGCPPT